MNASITICSECGGDIVASDSELVCDGCGLVVRETEIDRGPQWRSVDEESDRRHTGAPLTESRHDKGLSTEIGYENGSEVSDERQRQFVRLRRHHHNARISTKADRNRLYAYTEIRRLVSTLSLPVSVREQSCSLFATAQKNDLLCGRSLEGFAAATVYAVCRIQSIARTMDEIAEDARARRAELKTAYDALNTELDLPTGPIDPSEYLPRYASEIDVPTDVERRAGEYVERLAESGRIGGKNPSGVAAACLYVAALDDGISVTQQQVADLADVSRMTISSTVSDIKVVR